MLEEEDSARGPAEREARGDTANVRQFCSAAFCPIHVIPSASRILVVETCSTFPETSTVFVAAVVIRNIPVREVHRRPIRPQPRTLKRSVRQPKPNAPATRDLESFSVFCEAVNACEIAPVRLATVSRVVVRFRRIEETELAPLRHQDARRPAFVGLARHFGHPLAVARSWIPSVVVDVCYLAAAQFRRDDTLLWREPVANPVLTIRVRVGADPFTSFP